MNNEKYDAIAEAEYYYKKKDWPKIISTLDPLREAYKENFKYFFLLGIALLYVRDIGGAYSCLRRSYFLKHNNIDTVLALAVVHIMRGSADKAVELYLEVLEINPECKKAKMGLELIRQASDFDELTHSKKLIKLYPKPAFRAQILILTLAIMVIFVLLFLFAPILLKTLKTEKNVRPEIALIALSDDEKTNPIGNDGGFKIVMTEKDAVETFDKAKKLFNQSRDDAALVEINKILLSNSRQSIKNKAIELSRYISEPSFSNMPDKFSYNDVRQNPELYEGVAIVWKGLPANIDKSDTSTTFDFLIGYHEKKEILGIVPVKLKFEWNVEPDVALEILAKVHVEKSKINLDCLALHELRNGK